MSTLRDCLNLIESRFSQLGGELQRCARWAADHPREVGLLSMRQQAELAGATPTSMARMARAVGFEDYISFRKPFQDALGSPVPDFRERVSAMQSTSDAGSGLKPLLETVQLDNVRSACALNTPAQLDAAADAILRSKRVAFLGVRSCFAMSYHFHYAYSFIAGNGILVHGMGGAFAHELNNLDTEDLLVCVTQQPYSRVAIEAVQSCYERGIKVLVLTDSALSPAGAFAHHLVQFRADSPSYFHSMLGSLALVETLLARLAVRGGKSILDRLARVESSLESSNAYWSKSTPRKKK